MARYYRRRYRTIVRAPKKKWASNIQNIAMTTVGSTLLQFGTQDLVINTTETSTPTPVIIKTGNIKVQGDYYFRLNSSSSVQLALYVVFVPQGVPVTSATLANDLITNHPEWIMAWKYVGNDYGTTTAEVNSDRFSFSSRLKRNLNSGDTIKLIAIATGGDLNDVKVRGMVQYWTCAN